MLKINEITREIVVALPGPQVDTIKLQEFHIFAKCIKARYKRLWAATKSLDKSVLNQNA
jgi:hypothetical protein